jgi:hypothetical protein
MRPIGNSRFGFVFSLDESTIVSFQQLSVSVDCASCKLAFQFRRCQPSEPTHSNWGRWTEHQARGNVWSRAQRYSTSHGKFSVVVSSETIEEGSCLTWISRQSILYPIVGRTTHRIHEFWVFSACAFILEISITLVHTDDVQISKIRIDFALIHITPFRAGYLMIWHRSKTTLVSLLPEAQGRRSVNSTTVGSSSHSLALLATHHKSPVSCLQSMFWIEHCCQSTNGPLQILHRWVQSTSARSSGFFELLGRTELTRMPQIGSGAREAYW